MTDLNRREFLKLAGAGTAVAAGGGLGVFRLLDSQKHGDALTFRAVAGLPHAPLPAYASYVLEGNVDLAAKRGTIRRTIVAGAPEAMSTVLFHELTREMRVTDISGANDRFTLQAVMAGGTLSPGESPEATIVVDRTTSEVWAPLLANRVMLQLEP